MRGMKWLISLFLITSCIGTDVTYDFEGEWEATPIVLGGVVDSLSCSIHNGTMTIDADGERTSGDYYVHEGVLYCGWSIDLYGYDVMFLDGWMCNEDFFQMRVKPSHHYYPLTQNFKRR